MVLVDTSVWIRALRSQEPYLSELGRLLATRSVAGHPLVYGELLIGDSGGRTTCLEEYARFNSATSVEHEEVVFLARTRRLHGRGVGWIDVHLLASAITGRMMLWTADKPLAAIANELGVAYKGPSVH